MTQLFAADDKFADVVSELEARGWRRLPFVGCPKFDLKWTNYSKIAWRRVTSTQIVNHLEHSILFSQKNELTELLYTRAARHNQGQTQVDRCFPRTFDLNRPRDQRLLERWFLYSQAVGVLKESLRERSTVCAAQVTAATRMAKDVIADGEFFESWRRKDATWCGGDADEWQRLNSSSETTVGCNLKNEVLGLLSELERRDPQFHAAGTADNNVWICKPSNLSQGRGIVLCNSLQELALITASDGGKKLLKVGEKSTTATKWIVQKYIERPLLLQNGRKFDIRQWVLVTELEPKPKAFWFYRSYLRFCSRKFELTRLEDRFAHLSNYSVQQHFVPQEVVDVDLTGSMTSASSHRSDDVDGFQPMWSSEQLQSVLRLEHGRDVWSETILPQMQNIARLALSAVLPKLKVVGRGFEWLGFDFLVDDNHHAWLLEVNVSPDVSHSTVVTAELASKATADALNVLLDSENLRLSDNGWLPLCLEHQSEVAF